MSGSADAVADQRMGHRRGEGNACTASQPLRVNNQSTYASLRCNLLATAAGHCWSCSRCQFDCLGAVSGTEGSLLHIDSLNCLETLAYNLKVTLLPQQLFAWGLACLVSCSSQHPHGRTTLPAARSFHL